MNCGSIPEGTIDSELFGHEKGAFTGAIGEREGYFGAANGGTLFLDEVGELPLATQGTLVACAGDGRIHPGRFERRAQDGRAHRGGYQCQHGAAIRDGRFREDLFYRLNTIPVKMPALRERGDDVVLLFKKFAMDTAEKYNMPGSGGTDGSSPGKAEKIFVAGKRPPTEERDGTDFHPLSGADNYS